MNHLSGTARLANQFLAMRHGHSKANEAGLIVATIDHDRAVADALIGTSPCKTWLVVPQFPHGLPAPANTVVSLRS
jgi:hypothetical protein